MAAGLIFSISYNQMTEVFYRNSTGEWPQAQIFDQKIQCGGFFIGVFKRLNESSGTGFIIKLLNRKRLCALILTAAHIFTSDFSFVNETLDFCIGDEVYDATPINKKLDWDDLDSFLVDPISLNKLSCPDDWCICEMRKKKGLSYNSNLLEVKLASRFSNVSEGMDTYTIGYPGILKKEERVYAAPESTSKDLKAIRNAICYPHGPIITQGKIIKIGDVICSSAPTVNGMSGSPLFVEIKGKLRVIGILHGGPAAKLHFSISRLLNKVNSNDFQAELRFFYRELKEYLMKFSYKPMILRYLRSKCHEIIKLSIQDESTIDELYELCFQVYRKSIFLEANISPMQKYNIFYSINFLNKELQKLINRY